MFVSSRYLFFFRLDSYGWGPRTDRKLAFFLSFVSLVCPLASMAVQDEGIHALFFCNLSGCEQLVRGLKHVRGNRLYLVMTFNVSVMIEVSTGSS